MITYEKAVKLISKNTPVMPVCKTPVLQSINTVLAEDIYSKTAMPPFDKSAMDGYALKVCAIKRMPAIFECIGTIAAGENFKKKVGHNKCVKIMTGAPLPTETDTVVAIEDAIFENGRVTISKPVKKGQNVCRTAEDIKKGQKILSRSQRIKPSLLALAASAGLSSIRVFEKPTVAVLTTGNEIIETGKKLPRNKIYNSNGPMLCSLLRSDGFDCDYLGISKDTKSELDRYIKKGSKYDVFIISGGVSQGDYDLVPQVLKNAKVKKVFHKVSIKPGKPCFFAVKGKTIIFGLAGNPVSNFLGYHIFIKTALCKMIGQKKYYPIFKQGILTKDFFKKGNRRQFVLINAVEKNSIYYLNPVNSHGSADILSLSKANGFMVIGERTTLAKKNTLQKFILCQNQII